MQKAIMLKNHQLPVEIRINESTMAKELIKVKKDCDCAILFCQ